MAKGPKHWAPWAVPLAALVVLGALFLGGRSAAPKGGSGLAVGMRAPGFSLPSLSGGTLSLASLGGRPVVMDFFASWCRECQVGQPTLTRFARIESGKVRVLGIDLAVSEPQPADVSAFVRTYAIGYPIVLDRSGSVSDTYLVRSIPTEVVLDGSLRVRAVLSGALTLGQLQAAVAPYVQK